MEIVETKLAYATVRFASLKEAPARGAKIGAAIKFYRILQVFNKLFGSCRIQLANTTVRFATLPDALWTTSRMCPNVGFYIFDESSQNLVEVA